MGNIMIAVFLGMLKRILTEQLFSRLIVYGLHFLSQRTSNKLDDKAVAAIADALGVTDYL